jgi:hypothetical protein
MEKRRADLCASAVTAKRSSGSCASAASSSDNGTIFHQDINPIDREPTASIKDMNQDYLLDWDPTKRDVAKNRKKTVTIVEDARTGKTTKKGAASSVPTTTGANSVWKFEEIPTGNYHVKDYSRKVFTMSPTRQRDLRG